MSDNACITVNAYPVGKSGLTLIEGHHSWFVVSWYFILKEQQLLFLKQKHWHFDQQHICWFWWIDKSVESRYSNRYYNYAQLPDFELIYEAEFLVTFSKAKTYLVKFFKLILRDVDDVLTYGVYTSHLIRSARACSLYMDFISRVCSLHQKLHQQGYENNTVCIYVVWFPPGTCGPAEKICLYLNSICYNSLRSLDARIVRKVCGMFLIVTFWLRVDLNFKWCIHSRRRLPCPCIRSHFFCKLCDSVMFVDLCYQPIWFVIFAHWWTTLLP